MKNHAQQPATSPDVCKHCLKVHIEPEGVTELSAGFLTRDVAPGIFMLTNGNYQSLFVTTGEGVVLIDAPEPLVLAVIPLRNASGDASLNWLGGSFAEVRVVRIAAADDDVADGADHELVLAAFVVGRRPAEEIHIEGCGRFVVGGTGREMVEPDGLPAGGGEG